mmetsp:Transcript_29090/g.70232  ORF Transcript_29090/g.70232 Transcript_29090/m.70232 type:complete len:257 (+) Transcript_29090:765-1535(+)
MLFPEPHLSCAPPKSVQSRCMNQRPSNGYSQKSPIDTSVTLGDSLALFAGCLASGTCLQAQSTWHQPLDASPREASTPGIVLAEGFSMLPRISSGYKRHCRSHSRRVKCLNRSFHTLEHQRSEPPETYSLLRRSCLCLAREFPRHSTSENISRYPDISSQVHLCLVAPHSWLHLGLNLLLYIESQFRVQLSLLAIAVVLQLDLNACASLLGRHKPYWYQKTLQCTFHRPKEIENREHDVWFQHFLDISIPEIPASL